MTILGILISATLINNIVFTYFLGLWNTTSKEQSIQDVMVLSVKVLVMIVVSNIVIYPLNVLILEPLNITYMQTLIFILVIVGLTLGLNTLLKRYQKKSTYMTSFDLTLLLSNSLVLGVILINVSTPQTFIESMVFALGSGLGFGLFIIAHTAIRIRLEAYQIPKAFKGLPITLITTGLMALAFMGLSGLI